MAQNTTDRDEWWEQVTEAFSKNIPFKAEFNDGEGTVTQAPEGDTQ